MTLKRAEGSFKTAEDIVKLSAARKRYREAHPRVIAARPCAHCGTLIPAQKVNWKPEIRYCSDECRRQVANEAYRKHNLPPKQKQSTGTTGAISEMRVAVDLLQRGFPVFRALSPSCPCDLAILWTERALRVEVKTASRTQTGKINSPPIRNKNFDILAQVLPDAIIYTPELPSV